MDFGFSENVTSCKHSVLAGYSEQRSSRANDMIVNSCRVAVANTAFNLPSLNEGSDGIEMVAQVMVYEERKPLARLRAFHGKDAVNLRIARRETNEIFDELAKLGGGGMIGSVLQNFFDGMGVGSDGLFHSGHPQLILRLEVIQNERMGDPNPLRHRSR